MNNRTYDYGYEEELDAPLDMTRSIECPYVACGETVTVDLSDYAEDESVESRFEDDMGGELIHHFDFECDCPACGRRFQVSGHVSEYPLGAVNDEELRVEPLEEEDGDGER